MDIIKLITAEDLTSNPFFMTEFQKKLSYIPEAKKRLDYSGCSMPIYFVVNQKEWRKNEVSLYVNLCDGREHQRLEMEQPMNAHSALRSWRYALEVKYIEEEIEIAVTKINKQEITKPKNIVDNYPADEKEYEQLVENQISVMNEAYNKINNIK